MATKMKRFSISIPKELKPELDALKKKVFYNKPQSEMIRYLIGLGLSANKSDKEIK